MRCPYCNGPIENRLEFLPLSPKRREILDSIIKAGPPGLPERVLMERFFSEKQAKTTIRTTLHCINKAIAPMRIYVRGGVARLTRDESVSPQ